MTHLRRLLGKLLYILPRAILVGIFLFTLIVTVLSNFDYFEPYVPPVYLARASIRTLNSRVIIGPYPHLDEMKLLKKKGVQVIISLLDTSLPQEMALAKREAENARQLGIELRQYSLGYIPINSEKNRRVREQVINSVAGDQKKLYIHCYLGRHRVMYVAEKLAAQPGPH